MVTVCLTSIQLYLDYEDGIDNIHQRINQIKLTNIDSITQSLWTIDYSSIQIQLNGITRIKDIVYVELTDETNKTIASAGKFNTRDTITEIIYLEQNYRGSDTAIGHLRIIATKENVYRSLIDTAVIILISQAIKTFLVSIFVLVIFYTLVTRHIEKIANHTESINLTSRSEPLILDRKSKLSKSNDELSRLANAINTMSDNMYDSYIEIIDKRLMLTEREAKFSAIFDSISDSIVFVDHQRRILQTNRAFEKQFDYKLEDLKGKTTKLLYANPEEYDEQGKKRYNQNSSPAPAVYEIMYRRKDGSTFPSETMGGAVILPDKSLLGFIGIIRDVTSKKRAEKETQLLQNQLHQAQKMEAIGQLTGGLAHDFNNILASILGYAELITNELTSNPDPKLKKYVDYITRGGERARDLVLQLLAFSRGAPGKPSAIFLPEIIDEVSSLIQPTMPASIQITVEIDDNVPQVLMDKTHMHQIIMNLCINARDAMQGNGKLSIRLRSKYYTKTICSSCSKPVEGEYVELSIEDTGSGVHPDIIDSMFDPFKSTKKIGEGTGMGLSVVHGILHKHDSHIIVETQKGMGTKFHILIPPYLGEPTSQIEINTDKTRINIKGNNTNAQVLIIEDEQAVAEYLHDLLEEYNFSATATTNSIEAIGIIQSRLNDFNIIITDQTMPGISGTDIIRTIHELNPDFPVILCSGYNDNIDEQQAIKLGFKKYFEKPINSQRLIQTLNDLLTRQ